MTFPTSAPRSFAFSFSAIATATLLLLAPASFAQDDGAAAPPGMEPAKEVARFDGLIGKWSGEGGGQMWTPEGMQEFSWTSDSNYERVLDGHFVRETTRIVIDENPAMTMTFQSFFGFDRETSRYVGASVGNTGECSVSEIKWIDDHTMLMARVRSEENAFAGERWWTTVGKDTIEFIGREWRNGDTEFKHVWGNMKRVEKIDPIALDASFAPMPVAEPMHDIAGIAGEYRFAGTLQMDENAEFPVTGTESIRPGFGGHILEMTIHGDPIPGMGGAYEAYGFEGWNHEKGCYTSLYVSNFGEIGQGEVRRVGDRYVRTAMALRGGEPMVSRSIVTLGDDGKIEHVTEHTLIGTRGLLRSYDAKYTREGQK
jgi:hypothetical protein